MRGLTWDTVEHNQYEAVKARRILRRMNWAFDSFQAKNGFNNELVLDCLHTDLDWIIEKTPIDALEDILNLVESHESYAYHKQMWTFKTALVTWMSDVRVRCNGSENKENRA